MNCGDQTINDLGDPNNRIRLEVSHTKAKKAKTIPLNQAARQVLLDQRDEQLRDGLQTPYVFAHIDARWPGQRIVNFKNSFASACKRAGLKGVTPHTLRHTYASWLVMAGRPILEVRDILGHSTIKMTERYAHLAPENLVDAVSSIEDRLHLGSTATSDEQSPEDSSPQVIDKAAERWWARKDSNLRPMDYESTALTN